MIDLSDKTECRGLFSAGLNSTFASLLPEFCKEDLFYGQTEGGIARSTLYKDGLIALTCLISLFFSFLFV
jgi:hypothetical protein